LKREGVYFILVDNEIKIMRRKKSFRRPGQIFACQESGCQRLLQQTWGMFNVKFIKELANEKAIISRS
jgi:hypothetical protein